jgi:DNA sulfur modification protein DndD
LVPGDAASVALEFEHSQLGERTHYRVERSWTEKGKSCLECLTVLRDGSEIIGLTQEQAQGFLNQLVPPGVAQFFFFDGEKIASLATDGGDQALRESIRRILGLDLVERLRGDLANYLRQSREKQSSLLRGEIEALNAELEAAKQAIAIGEIRLREDVIPAVDRAKEVIESINAEINARGGAWARDRGSVSKRIDQLLEEKGGIESRIRDCVEADFPLALPRLPNNCTGRACRRTPT